MTRIRHITVAPYRYSKKRFRLRVCVHRTRAELVQRYRMRPGTIACWKSRRRGKSIGDIAFAVDTGFGAGLLAHEAVHAALGVMAYARTGRTTGAITWREEQLAWLVEHIVRSATVALYAMKVWPYE